MNTSAAEPTPRRPAHHWGILFLAIAMIAIAIPAIRFIYQELLPRNTFESATYKVRSGTKDHTFKDYDCSATTTDDIYESSWSYSCRSQTDNSRFEADSTEIEIISLPGALEMWTYQPHGNTLVEVRLTYSRPTRTLREKVNVYLYQFNSYHIPDDPASELEKLGVTNENLKHERDRILYETILPTILGRPVVDKDFQGINITTDQFLS
jgi:hypothetical protein